MKKGAVEEHALAAAAEANADIKIIGQDKMGDTIKGDNHCFSLRTPIDEEPSNAVEAARVMYPIFLHNWSSGLIRVATEQIHTAGDTIKRLQEALRKFHGRRRSKD